MGAHVRIYNILYWSHKIVSFLYKLQLNIFSNTKIKVIRHFLLHIGLDTNYYKNITTLTKNVLLLSFYNNILPIIFFTTWFFFILARLNRKARAVCIMLNNSWRKTIISMIQKKITKTTTCIKIFCVLPRSHF